MKSSLLLLLISVSLLGQAWKTALPGYAYQFPRDYFSHPDYQTEWWYYTGNLRDQQGRSFGFELTFFRSGLRVPESVPPSVWNPGQIYLAHFALSDINKQQFHYAERMNRAGPGIAGASLTEQRCWNGNWQVKWNGEQQSLQAVDDFGSVALRLKPEEPLVINGHDGISVKGPGEASHYLSFTRLTATGKVEVGGQSFAVNGLAWMDHEFFTEPQDATLAGWDWFSIQLNNGEELMLYRLRLTSGAFNPYSSGTFVDRAGNAHHLIASDFQLDAANAWEKYPMDWTIRVPSLQLNLSEHTTLKAQELVGRNGTTPSYWEGAVTYSGTEQAKPVQGAGYLEMTGYGAPVWLGRQAVHR